MPPSAPSPTSGAGGPRLAYTSCCSVPLGAGLATPPASRRAPAPWSLRAQPAASRTAATSSSSETAPPRPPPRGAGRRRASTQKSRHRPPPPAGSKLVVLRHSRRRRVRHRLVRAAADVRDVRAVRVVRVARLHRLDVQHVARRTARATAASPLKKFAAGVGGPHCDGRGRHWREFQAVRSLAATTRWASTTRAAREPRSSRCGGRRHAHRAGCAPHCAAVEALAAAARGGTGSGAMGDSVDDEIAAAQQSRGVQLAPVSTDDEFSAASRAGSPPPSPRAARRRRTRGWRRRGGSRPYGAAAPAERHPAPGGRDPPQGEEFDRIADREDEYHAAPARAVAGALARSRSATRRPTSRSARTRR